MTDLELLCHAKEYVDKMANGLNPLTDQPAADEDLINNVRISRCLFYVSDVLGKVIANGGDVGKKKNPANKKQPFHVPDDLANRFPYTERAIGITELVDNINALKTDAEKKLSLSCVRNWLLEKGFLEKQEKEDGKFRFAPTANGKQVGIVEELRQSKLGNQYFFTAYTTDAQHFIIDNLEQIISE